MFSKYLRSTTSQIPDISAFLVSSTQLLGNCQAHQGRPHSFFSVLLPGTVRRFFFLSVSRNGTAGCVYCWEPVTFLLVVGCKLPYLCHDRGGAHNESCARRSRAETSWRFAAVFAESPARYCFFVFWTLRKERNFEASWESRGDFEIFHTFLNFDCKLS